MEPIDKEGVLKTKATVVRFICIFQCLKHIVIMGGLRILQYKRFPLTAIFCEVKGGRWHTLLICLTYVTIGIILEAVFMAYEWAAQNWNIYAAIWLSRQFWPFWPLWPFYDISNISFQFLHCHFKIFDRVPHWKISCTLAALLAFKISF